MSGIQGRAGRALFGTRQVLSLALVLGLLAAYADRSASAGLHATLYITGNVFQAGTVDIAGALAGSTASTLPSATAFTWGAGGAGADCANVFQGIDITTQGMVPGHYCVAKVTIRNDNPVAIDAWMRVRLVRRTPADSGAADALNNRLRFYMGEYTAGTNRTAPAYQTADCTTAGFKPVSPVAGTAKSTSRIENVSSAEQGSRTAITSIGPQGINIGRHPGLNSPADPAVTSLANTGMGLTAGLPAGTPLNASLTDTEMSTNPANAATYNAYNVIGNDEVSNTRLISNSNTPNGTRPGGHLLEGQLKAGAVRHYCVAIFLPSDTDQALANAAGDTVAGTGDLMYHLVVTAHQQAKNTVN